MILSQIYHQDFFNVSPYQLIKKINQDTIDFIANIKDLFIKNQLTLSEKNKTSKIIKCTMQLNGRSINFLNSRI